MLFLHYFEEFCFCCFYIVFVFILWYNYFALYRLHGTLTLQSHASAVSFALHVVCTYQNLCFADFTLHVARICGLLLLQFYITCDLHIAESHFYHFHIAYGLLLQNPVFSTFHIAHGLRHVETCVCSFYIVC